MPRRAEKPRPVVDPGEDLIVEALAGVNANLEVVRGFIAAGDRYRSVKAVSQVRRDLGLLQGDDPDVVDLNRQVDELEAAAVALSVRPLDGYPAGPRRSSVG